MKALVYLIILLTVLALGFTFFQHNPDRVTLKYAFGLAVEINLAVALIGAMILGLLTGWLVSQLSVIQAKTQARRARRQVRRSELELESIRSVDPMA